MAPDPIRRRLFHRSARAHFSANTASLGQVRPARNNTHAASTIIAALNRNIQNLFWASNVSNGKFEKSAADAAPKPSDTKRMGRVQQINVVEDARKTTQPHCFDSISCSTMVSLLLDRRARNGSVGAKYATVTSLRVNHGTTAFTLIEILACVLWHSFRLLMSALRT